MTVLRIVADLETREPGNLAAFYAELLDLEIVMDQGWIVTAASQENTLAQVSFLSEGGSGTPCPALSIEVDDLDDTLKRARGMNCDIEYGPEIEPWGVRRFFVRDPAGNLLNILSHQEV